MNDSSPSSGLSIPSSSLGLTSILLLIPEPSEPRFVIKRSGKKEDINEEKITKRLQRLKEDVENYYTSINEHSKKFVLDVDIEWIAQKTCREIYNGITTSEIDTFAAEICAYNTDHHHYQLFGGNILISNLEANNRNVIPFAEYARQAYHFVNETTGERHHLISHEVYEIAQKKGHIIDARIQLRRNFGYDYFAVQTLIRGRYLLAAYGHIQENRVKRRGMVAFETPQHMLMRVAIGIHGQDLTSAFELYEVTSQKFATNATPTLFHAGTLHPQLASCFLLSMEDDSIEGIYNTLKKCAIISKFAGGIGLAVSNIRGDGSYIASTNGTSNGIVPMLQVFNNTARYVDQGGGKRKGSFAIYLEPHHPDIMAFVKMKSPTTEKDRQGLDLFYAIWASDIFMQRVIEGHKKPANDPNPVMWSLFDPKTCPGLDDAYGEEYTKLYLRYEAEHKYIEGEQIPIRELWKAIMTVMKENGIPYLMFKDHINNKSNQKNLGTIHCSNLCTEIVEFTSPTEIAVCTLASVSLPNFVKYRLNAQTNQLEAYFDYDKLFYVSKVMTKALDKIIDINFYPVPEAKHSNTQHRPIGLGIQGQADAACLLKIPFDSKEAMKWNKQFSEVMYFGCLTQSNELAKLNGHYPSMKKLGKDGKGAPISEGIFQFDLWNTKPDQELKLDWKTLRENILLHGVRNSLTTCSMPSASTSILMGNQECFEPYFSNFTIRKTKSGEFTVLNKYLLDDLIERGLWKYQIHPVTKRKWIPIKAKLRLANGSVQKIVEIPQDLKDLYRTTMEIPRKNLVDLVLAKAPFIDQMSSHNVYYESKDDIIVDMTKTLCYLWKQGSKFGSYYSRFVQLSDILDFTGNNADLEEFQLLELQKGNPEEKKVVDKIDEESKQNINYQFLDVKNQEVENKEEKLQSTNHSVLDIIDNTVLTIKENQTLTNEISIEEQYFMKNSKFRKSQNAKHGIYDQDDVEFTTVQKGLTNVVQCVSCSG